MADKKISDLTSISSTDVASADIIPIVDITAGLTKSITISNLKTSIFSSPTFTGVVTFQGSITDTNNNLTLTGEQLRINSDQAAAINIDSFSTGNSAIFRVNAVTDTVSTANLTTSGDLTVNTSAPDSPPNSPFSAPVFIVDSSTERVGINKAIPTEALDVVGNIKATGGITGTTLRSPADSNLIIDTGAGGNLSIGATVGPSSGGDVNITDINNISGNMGDINLKADPTAKIQVGGARADIFNVSSTTDGFGSVFNISAASGQKISNYVLAEFSAGINVTGDSKFVNALGIGRDPSGGHTLAVNGNADVGSILSSNTFETTQATISGNLVVNTNAADSPPNSPFSAPVFKVNATTEKVGINKSIPAVELDVVGDVTATGSITGATLGGTLTTAAQTNITSVGTLTALVMGGTLNMGGQDITNAGNISGSTISGSTLAGTLSTAAQTNITSVGTLTGLTVNGNVDLSRIAGDNNIRIQPTTPSSDDGHHLYIEAGQEGVSNGDGGGNLYLYSGQGGSGDGGNVIIDAGGGDESGEIRIGYSEAERIRLGGANTAFTISNQSGFRSAIGLGNVTNESKATMFTDPTFTGNPQSNAAPSSGDHLTNKTYVDAEIAGLVDSAPAALNTLNDLADALGDDENFATTTATALGNRVRTDTASQGLNSTQKSNAITNLGLGNVENKSSADIRGEIVDSDIPSGIARDAELTAHTSLTNNPHSVTATQVSLGNVTNESKATMFSNPTFTGNVDLSRIAGNNEIKIEPDTNTSHNLILKAASQTGQVDGGTPPSGGDITIQAGDSANQDNDYGTTTVGGSVLIKGGEGGDSGGGDGDIGAVGGNVTIEGGPGGGGNAGGAYGQINIGVNNTNQVNIGSISNVVSVINSKAPKANPIFTGTTTIPTLEIGSGGISSNAFNQDLVIFGHSSGGAAPGASINITGGSNNANQNGGDVIIAGGYTSEGSSGGNVRIRGGNNNDDSSGDGIVYIGDVNTSEVRIGTNSVFTGHVLPSVDVTQDLGSSSKRWRDLYVSGGTIHLGNVKVKEESGSFKIKDASDNAVPIGDATFAGTTTLGGNISLTSATTEFKPTSVSGEDSVGKTLRLEAGDASGENSQAGNLILNAGDRISGSGSGTDGNVQIGLNHTNAVQITPNTTISGTLTVTGAATLNGGFGGTISSATITTLTSTTVNSDTIRGDDFTNSTPGGSVLIRGGNTASNDGHNGGNINIQGGQATDSEGGDDGNINIGTSNTKAVNIGASGKTTTINGTLSTPNDPLVKNDFGVASIRKVTSGEYNSITTKDENTFYVEVDGIAIFVDCEVGSGANPARNFTAILRDDDNVNTPNPNTLYPAVSIPHAGTGSTDTSDDSPRTALGSGTWIGNVFGSNLQNDSPLRRITVRLAPQSGSGDSTTHSTITVEKGGTLISNTDSTVSGDTVTDVVIELSGTEDVLLSYGTE